MRVGAENRKVLVVAVTLAAIAVVLFVRMLLITAEPPPVAAQATPAERSPQARRVLRGGPQLPAANTLDPTLRLDLLRATESIEYKGSGRNIFREYVPPPPVVEKPVVVQQPTIQCPGDPRCPPPPIPLKFFGFASRPGEAKKVFLSHEGDVFIAGEGEIVNRRYRVLRIGVNSVEIEDVLSNHRQTIPLTSG